MINTGVMCLLHIHDESKEFNTRVVDMGNYFLNDSGKKVLVTSALLARQYANLVHVPVYIFKKNKGV